MKVKVKGLVFAGFAAAVFAQSAMADTAQDAADMKTVTSKYYVDQTFQTKAKIVSSVPSGNDAETQWADTTTYPSMAVLNSVRTAAASATNAITVTGDSGDFVQVTRDGSTFTVAPEQTPATAASGITGTTVGTYDGTTLVTVAAVKDAVVETVSSSSTDAQIPTAAAVYGYAQAKSAFDQSAETEQGSGIYAPTIGSNSSNDTYPSSKNVYQFVTNAIATSNNTAAGAYQAKIAEGSTGLYVGARNAGDTDSTWTGLSGTGYVAIGGNVTNGYTINLDAAQVGTADTDVADTGTKLLTGNAVYDYISGKTLPATATSDGNGGYTYDANGWATASNNTFPTSANVAEYVTDSIATAVAALPTSTALADMPAACKTADGGHYCALVASYDANAAGNVKYEWTVMAPTTSN